MTTPHQKANKQKEAVENHESNTATLFYSALVETLEHETIAQSHTASKC